MRVECESSTLTPRPLFIGRMVGHRSRRQASMASDCWGKGGPLAIGKGPADPRVRPNPRWPTLLTARAHYLSNGHKHFELWCLPNIASIDVQNYFSKNFNAQKYFLIFVKIEKVLEKFLACKSVLKIQICSGENQKSREKQNGGK